MGVSKVGEEGRDRPRTGGGLWFLAKEVLVGSGGLGVSRNFPGKSSPSSPFPPFSTPFSPPWSLPPILPPSKPSLQLSRSGLFAFSTPPNLFFLLRTLLSLPQSFLSPPSESFRNPSESLYRPSKSPLKVQKGPF